VSSLFSLCEFFFVDAFVCFVRAVFGCFWAFCRNKVLENSGFQFNRILGGKEEKNDLQLHEYESSSAVQRTGGKSDKRT
jgi:hypothetical protein